MINYVFDFAHCADRTRMSREFGRPCFSYPRIRDFMISGGLVLGGCIVIFFFWNLGFDFQTLEVEFEFKIRGIVYFRKTNLTP